MPPSLSLQGGRRPTWRPEREARGSALGVQSRESSCVFADGFPVIRPGTARLPRRFAPRNDTSGGAVVHQCPPAAEFSCTRRSLSAATDAIGWYILSTACTVRRCSAGRGMPGPYNGVSEIKGARKIKGSSELINKSGWREIFWQGEVWKVQLYFVYPQGACRIRKAAKPPTASQYHKLSKPMD